MSRQSISLTSPNADWLRKKVEVEGEYKSNSEVVNDLIRRAREIELETLRAALIEGERSGLSAADATDARRAVQERMTQRGKLPSQS